MPIDDIMKRESCPYARPLNEGKQCEITYLLCKISRLYDHCSKYRAKQEGRETVFPKLEKMADSYKK